MPRPQIIERIQGISRKVLKDNSILIESLDKDMPFYPEVYTLVKGHRHEFYFDKETEYRVGLIPLFVTEKNLYWIAITIAYNHDLKAPKHISISYFDQNKEKMFRADWSNNESLIEHGQPHWHFHNHVTNFTSEVWNPEELNDFFDDIQLNSNNKIDHIHFAMSSSWHLDFSNGKNLSDCQESEVLKWVEGVLTYSNQQLTYLHDKSKIL
jgi:hypothetical protein